jgi:hypothetical protein
MRSLTSFDLYEFVVQTHLTGEGCAVIPQVPILHSVEGKRWEAYPDFLAINFRRKELQIVEVSKDGSLGKARKLAEKLAPEYRNTIEQHIRTITLNGQLDSFGFVWRFFLRKGIAERFKSLGHAQAYVDSGNRLEVMTLEDVFESVKTTMP